MIAHRGLQEMMKEDRIASRELAVLDRKFLADDCRLDREICRASRGAYQT